ncbi:MAG TPA: hypothetical protein VHN11_01580 [Xanthobacteraceae bacterium]|nr:hypothetical protein [Xanthobacteraceae bacterium]
MEPATTGLSDAENPFDHSNPVEKALDRYVQRAAGIEFCAREFVPEAEKRRKQEFKEVASLLGTLAYESAMVQKHGGEISAPTLKNTRALYRKTEQLILASSVEILKESLFISLFSAFDAFVGDLMLALMQIKPSILDGTDRKISLAELMRCDSIDDAKKFVVEHEIDTLRRKSYPEQFSHLSSRFGVELKKFKNWPVFVECSQRRNLITHCGGQISEQYRKVCLSEGVHESALAKVGTKIKLSDEYFASALEVVSEVAIKLTQTLWRKIDGKNLGKADDHLVGYTYRSLLDEKWARAIMICDFGLELPKSCAVSTEKRARMIVINKAIAHKASGDSRSMARALGRFDWTACSDEFAMAVAILEDKVQEAAKLMLRLGTDSRLFREEDYLEWPLFRDFRTTPEFQRAYAEVFGRPFVDKIHMVAVDAAAQAGKLVKDSGDSSPGAGTDVEAGE